jgi:hypothetical protein
MGIFNFKQFLLERHGVSESSLMFVDVLENKTYYSFIDFLNSKETKLDERVEIKYRTLVPYIKDKQLYADFPVVGFELILDFKKMMPLKFNSLYGYANYTAIGGYASGFGNKNWKNYSKIVKPVKQVTDHGLIIQLSVGIDIDKINFDINKPEHKESIIDGIASTLYHELNHCYEHYKRTKKGTKRGEYRPIYDRSFNTSLTYAENNKWKFPKAIWQKWNSEFLKYIYMSESHEMNANVQEIKYFITKYPEKDVKEFKIWQTFDKMQKFDADMFYVYLINEISAHYNWKDTSNELLAGCKDEKEVADKLKQMWVEVYEKEVKDQNAKPIIPLDTFRKMSCKQFIEYWGRQFNKNGDNIKKKISKIINDKNEEIQ